MYIPPGTPRSRSFTRFTMRVGLPHLGQLVDFVVSMIFSRFAIFAILAIFRLLLLMVLSLLTHATFANGFNDAALRPPSRLLLHDAKIQNSLH